jgi:hypothetical protein
MGQWGTKPCENDDACDFFYLMPEKDNFPAHIWTYLKQDDASVVRGPAFVLAQIAKYIRDPNLFQRHVTKAIKRLKELLTDEEWLADLSDKTALKKSVKKQISDLEKVLLQLEWFFSR